MNLSIRKSGSKRGTHYSSIHDLPFWNWKEARKEEDLSYLIRDKNHQGTKVEYYKSVDLKNVYLGLITEFFKEFGQSKQFKNELKIKNELFDMNIQYLKTGQRILLNNIAQLRSQLEKKRLENVENDLDFDINKEEKKQLALVSKSLSTPVDARKITVVQFYTQLTLITELDG